MFEQIDLLKAATIFVGGIVWLVRLEGRINQLEKLNSRTQEDVDDLRKRHEALDERLIIKLSEIEKALARIEGYLGKDGLDTRG